jgi:FtsP/CotA-like multicopper oxidase with cupredoxin domain
VYRPLALLLIASVAAVGDWHGARSAERVVPNDNRQAAGDLRDGVLTLRLEARLGDWHPDGDNAPGAEVPAFAEAGKPTQIPGPFIRVSAGTRVSATVRNSLPNDTLIVHGLYTREPGSKEGPAIELPPGQERRVEFLLGAPGTFYYWGTTMRRALAVRSREDSQLSGAIVVDPPASSGSATAAPAADRVFVIGIWSDTSGAALRHGRKRILSVINGRSWPNTERLRYTVGDSVRWRVINTSADLHPMHLHGFYFRVDARGDEVRDTEYAPAERDRVVTDLLTVGTTLRMSWVPERDGNWAFHCHLPEHIEARGPLGLRGSPARSHDQNHAGSGMGGLVIGIRVDPKPGEASTATRGDAGRRRYRLVVQETPNARSDSTLTFALGEARAKPVTTGGHVGPPIVVNVGEPVSVTVVNQSSHATAVHWHGIELESYFDGIAGFSGTGTRLAPVIAPRDSFEARFTPPRPGTFIYHSHVDEGRQQPAGLIGAIIVLAPGQRYDPATDLLAVISSPPDSADESRAVLINGVLEPSPITLRAGAAYRLRMINLTTARPGTRVELRGDSALATWRLLAQDGADLPAERRVVQPSVRRLSIGQTFDVEVAPVRPGEMRLRVVGNAGDVLGTLLFRVER